MGYQHSDCKLARRSPRTTPSLCFTMCSLRFLGFLGFLSGFCLGLLGFDFLSFGFLRLRLSSMPLCSPIPVMLGSSMTRHSKVQLIVSSRNAIPSRFARGQRKTSDMAKAERKLFTKNHVSLHCLQVVNSKMTSIPSCEQICTRDASGGRPPAQQDARLTMPGGQARILKPGSRLLRRSGGNRQMAPQPCQKQPLEPGH